MWSILREDTKRHFRIREEIRETSGLRTVVEEVRIRKGAWMAGFCKCAVHPDESLRIAVCRLATTEELWGTPGAETASYAWNSNQY
jgi:hypothetical protein